MGEMINKEFEEYQRQLDIRNKKIKGVAHFEYDEKLDTLLDELNKIKISL